MEAKNNYGFEPLSYAMQICKLNYEFDFLMDNNSMQGYFLSSVLLFGTIDILNILSSVNCAIQPNKIGVTILNGRADGDDDRTL